VKTGKTFDPSGGKQRKVISIDTNTSGRVPLPRALASGFWPANSSPAFFHMFDRYLASSFNACLM
jgi:hypothetical protein